MIYIFKVLYLMKIFSSLLSLQVVIMLVINKVGKKYIKLLNKYCIIFASFGILFRQCLVLVGYTGVDESVRVGQVEDNLTVHDRSLICLYQSCKRNRSALITITTFNHLFVRKLLYLQSDFNPQIHLCGVVISQLYFCSSDLTVCIIVPEVL